MNSLKKIKIILYNLYFFKIIMVYKYNKKYNKFLKKEILIIKKAKLRIF